MSWYAARNVYHFGSKNDGKNIFEERIVSFEAEDIDEAHLKAAKEALQYSDDNGFDVHDQQLIYKQDGKSLVDGYEIWSELFEAYKSLNEFYLERYQNYIYNAKED